MKPIKYYQLKILSRTDFIDNRLLELREKIISPKEYSAIIQQMQISNDNSRNLLEFIANYDNGFFLPEKCDAYEPIREKFELYNLIAPISWLSQPGGAVYLKKIKPFKIEGVIENHRLAMVWDENGMPSSIDRGAYAARDPYYLCEIWLHIDEKIIKIKSKDYLIEFFKKLFDKINGEYGYLKSPEDEEIIAIGEKYTA